MAKVPPRRTEGLNLRIDCAAALLMILVAFAPGGALAQRTLAVAPAAQGEQRVALLIGNSAYKESPLKNPVNDAADMAAALRDLGFKVTLRTDASQREMKQALREFARDIKNGGVGLFYFAGHGVQSRGRNFLVPIGASIESEAEIEDETIDANLVLSYMDEAQNRVNIVVLDACRNNPFARSFRSASRGLAQMDAGKGSFIAFATAPGAVAADGSGRNGIYTEQLLASLKQPDGDIDKVFRRVAADVSKGTGGKQVPWVSSSLTGDFYFRTPAPTVVDDGKLKQLEKERTDLAKALQEEQKQRNKDAEFVRAEMEKLRAELQKIREGAVPPAAQAAVPGQSTSATSRPAPGATSTMPAQAASPAPLPSPMSPSSPPAEASKLPRVSPTSAPPAQQLAIAAPPGRRAAMAAAADEWKNVIAVLEKSHGQLTYSKAIALLLGIKADDELELLVKYDALLGRLPFNSASALGVNAAGFIDYLNSARERTPKHAADAALEGCNKRNTLGSCRVVMVNREFQETGFVEVARRLGRQPRDAVRQAALRRIAMSLEVSAGR